MLQQTSKSKLLPGATLSVCLVTGIGNPVADIPPDNTKREVLVLLFVFDEQTRGHGNPQLIQDHQITTDKNVGRRPPYYAEFKGTRLELLTEEVPCLMFHNIFRRIDMVHRCIT